jgi:DNA-binding transcriptional LysR family regulator
MEIRQLKTFLTIAKLGTFTKAAHFLGYTPSTVTTHIQLLEKELNVILLERLGQQITLTKHGQEFYDYADKIVRLECESKSALHKSHIPSGPLTIGMSESLCVFRMTALIKEYNLLYPTVELNLKVGISSDFRALLRKNILDLAFFLEPSFSDPDLTYSLLWPEPIVLLSSPTHVLTKLEEVEPKHLRDQTLVLVESGSNYRLALEKDLEHAGIRLKAVLEIGQIEVIKQLVIHNSGITLLPLVSVQKEIQAGELVVLPWRGTEVQMNAFLVYHKNKWLNDSMKAFMTLVRKEKKLIYANLK